MNIRYAEERRTNRTKKERFRYGLCDSCPPQNAVKCFAIEKKLGGAIQVRRPLTKTNQVYKGVCLKCHPGEDPEVWERLSDIAQNRPYRRRLTIHNKVMLRRQTGVRDLKYTKDEGYHLFDSVNESSSITAIDEEVPAMLELTFPKMDSASPSAITLDTCLNGDDQNANNERCSREYSLPIVRSPLHVEQKSFISHQNHEPHGNQYLREDVATNIEVLQEIIDNCTQAGLDKYAIDLLTQSLVQCNSSPFSTEVTLFCLTTLCVLSSESIEKKEMISMTDSLVDAVIESMRSNINKSDEIQEKGCSLLFSLSTIPFALEWVVQAGGCEAILNVMMSHAENESVQYMAIRVLKVFSLDNLARSILNQWHASSIIADCMLKNTDRLSVQSQGCEILCNLVIKSDNKLEHQDFEREINAIANAIISHSYSSDFLDVAYNALLNFGFSSTILKEMRENAQLRVALDFALKNNSKAFGKKLQDLLSLLEINITLF